MVPKIALRLGPAPRPVVTPSTRRRRTYWFGHRPAIIQPLTRPAASAAKRRTSKEKPVQQETPPEQEDIGEGLEQQHIQAVIEAVDTQNAARLDELLEPLHAADVADLVEQISPPERRELVALWGKNINGAILSEL